MYTTVKNGVAARPAGRLAGVRCRPAAIRAIPPRSWGWLAVIGIVGGSVPFLLFFTGLAQAQRAHRRLHSQNPVVWVALLGAPLLGERLGFAQVAALGVLVGQAMLLTPAGVTWARARP